MKLHPNTISMGALGLLFFVSVSYKPITEASKNNSEIEINSEITNPKVKAFLDTIAYAETGTTSALGYSFIVFKGGNKFSNFSTHPFVGGGWRASKNCAYIRRSGRVVCSSAAGRYQIMDFNYRKFIRKGLVSDFSPESQDKMAMYFIEAEGALDDILQGRIEKAFCKVGNIWASFPCNNYKQPQKTFQRLKQVYLRQLKKYE